MDAFHCCQPRGRRLIVTATEMRAEVFDLVVDDDTSPNLALPPAATAAAHVAANDYIHEDSGSDYGPGEDALLLGAILLTILADRQFGACCRAFRSLAKWQFEHVRALRAAGT